MRKSRKFPTTCPSLEIGLILNAYIIFTSQFLSQCTSCKAYFTHLSWNSPASLHTERYFLQTRSLHTHSLQTQCSNRWCLLSDLERGWCWPLDHPWRWWCSCSPDFCRKSLYHTRWCRCTVHVEMCSSQTHWWYQWHQHELQEHHFCHLTERTVTVNCKCQDQCTFKRKVICCQPTTFLFIYAGAN